MDELNDDDDDGPCTCRRHNPAAPRLLRQVHIVNFAHDPCTYFKNPLIRMDVRVCT